MPENAVPSAPTPRGASRRRAAATGLAVVALAGLALASASQLSVVSSSLGAGSTAVATCQPADRPIAVGYVTGRAPGGAYVVTHVTVSDVARACGGRQAAVQMVGTDGSPLGPELRGPVPAGGGSWTLDVPDVAVTALGGLSGVIRD